MATGDVSLACATALIDELVASGMRHACVSPGSRSTPLALALERHAGITVHVHLDERSSAFFALGLAKALRRPVAVACTSGTAAAELYPAVVEASQARVPLYLLTADRPPRLRGTGANQTIDQVRLFGTYPRAYLDPPVPAVCRTTRWRGGGSDVRRWRPAAVHSRDRCTSTARSRSPWCRPVTSSSVPERDPARVERADRNPEPLAADVDRAARELSGARGVVVAGSNWWMASSEVALLAQRLGWPLLAEPTSGLRQPGWAALAAGQSLIASTAFLERHRPEVVLQIGATPTTRASQAFVASAERLLVVDLFHPDPDPERQATWRLAANPDRLAAGVMERPIEPAPDGWFASWQDADAQARTSDGRACSTRPTSPRSSVSRGTWPRPSPKRARCSSGTRRRSGISTSRWRRATGSRYWRTAARAASTVSSPPRSASRPPAPARRSR